MNNYVDNGIVLFFFCFFFFLILINHLSGEWKLLQSWTVLSTLIYPCCDEAYHDIKFYFHIRRRTLYYTYNVIIPCIMLSILTCLTFYLPTESGEKVSLGLTVLLSFSVFMLLIAESMPATSEFIPLIGLFVRNETSTKKSFLVSFFFSSGIYFTLVMGLTSLSVLLAVVLLNVHLYGSALKPVPRRLRSILFYHVAPILRVRLHRTTATKEQKPAQRTSTAVARRSTTVYNAVFLNDTNLTDNSLQPDSTMMTGNAKNDVRTNSTTPRTFNDCKRLLHELNRIVLRPSETNEEDTIMRDWQNVALVFDRCLLYIYIILTTLLTTFTLLLAPLLKTVPKPPEYFRLNITRE